MFEVLFGNKTVQKILIFLFVNGKSYGTELHKSLKSPLTPIQKALLKLEKGGLIMSYYEGKTRLYQFNPAFPLLPELETLLKKAYTLLPAQEKKLYYVAKEDSSPHIENPTNKIQILLAFWDKLSSVTQLSCRVKTKSHATQGWIGSGEVSVSKEGSNVMIFNEKGNWKNKQNNETNFSNIFRWTFDRHAGMISLEHLRRGLNNPVFIFHLTPSGNHALKSVDSHLCGGDTYMGKIHFDSHTLRLNWRVIGPKKNEELDYYYS